MPDCQEKNYIELNNTSFVYDECIPKLFHKRISEWLTPGPEKEGWYRAHEVDSQHLLIKAKCVLQELYLLGRCERQFVEIIDWNTEPRVRKAIFRVIYRMQNFILRFRETNKP